MRCAYVKAWTQKQDCAATVRPSIGGKVSRSGVFAVPPHMKSYNNIYNTKFQVDKIVIVGVYHFDCHAKITCFVQDATGVFLLFKACNDKIIIN